MNSGSQRRQLKMNGPLLITIQIGFIKVIQDKILTVVIIQRGNNIVAYAGTGSIDSGRVAELNNQDRIFIGYASAYKFLIVQVGFYYRTFLVIIGIISGTPNNEICEESVRVIAAILCVQTQLPVTKLVIYVLGYFK